MSRLDILSNNHKVKNINQQIEKLQSRRKNDKKFPFGHLITTTPVNEDGLHSESSRNRTRMLAPGATETSEDVAGRVVTPCLKTRPGRWEACHDASACFIAGSYTFPIMEFKANRGFLRQFRGRIQGYFSDKKHTNPSCNHGRLMQYLRVRYLRVF